VAVQQLDKATWQVDCVPSSPLVLSYEVYAFDNSVRAAWLDTQRGFFNGTSLCLRVHGQAQEPHELELVAPRAYPHWEAATGLEPLKTGKRGFGTYAAATTTSWWTARWRSALLQRRVPRRRRAAPLVVAGATESFDSDALVADTQKICEAEIRFWHDAASRRSRATCSCSTRWTTATAAWSTATPPP
jgi:predicted metalloprotease with PDZ domain